MEKHSSFTDVRSEPLSRLLRYTVEKTLAGFGDELKEYAIVLEVYEKSSYDPSFGSLVRVEVIQEDYWQGGGKHSW